MSEGPIKREREARRPPTVSTTRSTAVHMMADIHTRGVCGHRGDSRTTSRELVTCADCLAALRSDGQ